MRSLWEAGTSKTILRRHEDIVNKQTKVSIGVMVIYPVCFALVIALLIYRGLSALPDTSIINVSIDLFGMLMGYVLYVCCRFDAEKSDSNLKYFFFLHNAAYLGLFVDAVSWLVDGVAQLRMINVIDNYLYFMCAPLQAFCYYKYISNVIRLEGKGYRILDKLMNGGLILGIAVRLLNVFFGHYFTVSADGVYSRGFLYPLSMLYVFFTLIAMMVVIIKERKQLKTYQLVVLFTYIFAPLVTVVFTVMVYGLSLSPSVIMLILLLMYCAINISQGKEKAVAARDLSVASSIQRDVLPQIFPYLPERKEFDIYASMTAAKEVGGDFYDFFMVDEDHLCLVMADVSGKGIPAALFMMVARTMIKNYALTGQYSPSKILEHVNDQLCEGNTAGLFVTVWLAIVDLRTGKGYAANAGHEHPALCRSGGKFELVKYRHSVAVATMEGMAFKEHEFELLPGDTFFVYTDGVSEATNAQLEQFGEERLITALNKDPSASPKELLSNVYDDIVAFVNGAEQFDDITMLSFKYFG